MTVSFVLGWALAVFFFVTGVINCAGSPGIRAGFKRWGYPPFMHWVTGLLELLAAALMAVPTTRILGLLLGLAIILAGLATVVRHREYAHAIPPAVTILLLLAWGALLSGLGG